MALIRCPECDKEVSDKAATCPNCGIGIAIPSPDLFAHADASPSVSPELSKAPAADWLFHVSQQLGLHRQIPNRETAVFIAVLVGVIILGAISGAITSAGSGDGGVASSPASPPPQNSGPAAESLSQIVTQLGPLTTRYEILGPVSARIYLDPSLWNSLSPDQQRQFIDALASKKIVQDTGMRIHLFVVNTEVGVVP